MSTVKTTTDEIWKNISWIDKIDPEKYSVSTKGVVKNNYNGKILSQHLKCDKRGARKGTYNVNLFNGTTGFNTNRSVCRLVAHAFIDTHGIDEKGLIAYNKDGNISNNNVENVSWIIGGPNSNDNKIDISYVDKINKVIIKYNNLPNIQLVEKVSKAINIDVSKSTVQRYRSVIAGHFQEVKNSSSDVDSFWSNDDIINVCKNNSVKKTRTVAKYDIDGNITDIFLSVKEALKKCKISDKTFYRHIKCKSDYPYIIEKSSGQKYILEYLTE